MKRIDPSLIPDLYVKHQLTPEQGTTLKKDEGKACLLGLLYVDECSPVILNDPGFVIAIAQLARRGYDPEYLRGLMTGFDGRRLKIDEDESEYVIDGFEDGRTAVKLLIAKGMEWLR
jgi:hypothetical protein